MSSLGIRCFVTCGGKNWEKSKNEGGKLGTDGGRGANVEAKIRLSFDSLSYTSSS